MLDSRVKALADALGCKLVERNASESFVYDGESLALYCQYGGDEYNLAPHPRQYATDHDILHELGHLAGAPEEQRDLPEFGLSVGVVVGDALGPRVLYRTWKDRLAICDGVVMDKREEDIQEFFAQMFATFFGMVWNLSVGFGYNNPEDIWKTWDNYHQYKEEEVQETLQDNPEVINWRQEAKERLWAWLHANWEMFGEIDEAHCHDMPE